MNLIDNFLNQITMYRLMLYFLIILLAVAFIYSVFGVLPYNPLNLVFGTLFLVAVCWLANTIFAKVFRVPTNLESIYISALILALIIDPFKNLDNLPFFFWAAVLVAASKFVFAIGKKHIFNPVAMSVFLTSIFIGQAASWWVGRASMAPFVLLGGILIVRKIRRFDLVFYFFLISILTIFVLGLKNNDPWTFIQKILLESPILFFAFVMLTEPLTTPPTKFWQIIYAALTGILFAPQLKIGQFYTTPESALLIGNIFSYLVSPKQKLVLKLKEKVQLAPDIFDFIFTSNQKFNFKPGQYMEWTLGHQSPDNRGSRRYFTLASSPTEDGVRVGVKIYEKASSFKSSLSKLQPGAEIVAGQLAGEFVLPKDESKKIVFIAGGIGITPYRSMLKYLVDTNQKRNIIMFFSNKAPEETVYTDIFNQAAQKLGIHTVYTVTDKVPENWKHEKGRVTPEMIKKYAPDYKDRIFYLSGPHSMVSGFEKTLHVMKVPNDHIKIDFFPGFV